MLKSKISVLMRDNTANPAIEDSVGVLRRAGFSDAYISQFTDKAVGVLNDYGELLGEGTEFRYRIIRGLFRIELRMYAAGEEFDPFTSGRGARKRSIESLLHLNLNTEATRLSYKYAFGYNILSASVPLTERKKKILGDPVIIACVLGILCGLLCQHLPQAANSFIVDELASPLTSIMLKLVAGIMGPVIFISMTTSILSFENISELTHMGVKIIKRFILATVFVLAVSIAVSAVFYRIVGRGDISFDPDQLVQLLLNIIPTNIIQPFLDNNTPQLVILGFLFGAALLLLGDRVKELNVVLLQIDEWIMSVMKIIMTVLPVIPFLCIMTTLAKGNGRQLLEGWKFIAASYIVFTITTLAKAVKTLAVTKIGISECWRKMKPVVKIAFSTGSNSAPLRKSYEVSDEFGIRQEFASFWIPLSSAMLSPKTTVNLVVAAFMMAEILNVPVSGSFFLVLIILTMELSLASPGVASAWVILLESLAMPVSYVGLFTAYRVLTAGYSAACTQAYVMFEELEAACKLDGYSYKDSAPG